MIPISWFKVDDKFHSHPKVLSVPLRALGLWVKAGAWSSDQLTDGYIPKAALGILGANAGDARALVDAGLWEPADGGWTFHDWDEMQPSRAATLARREEDKKRKADARAARAALREEKRK